MGTNKSFSQAACLSQCLVGYVSSLEGDIDIKKAGFAYNAWKEQSHSPKWWFDGHARLNDGNPHTVMASQPSPPHQTYPPQEIRV